MNKKLTLEDLKVKSFVTADKAKLLGGATLWCTTNTHDTARRVNCCH